MPTGACGINCDVCKLNVLGTCSSCGSGISADAEKKLSAQQRLLGSACAILACAKVNQIEYCMRDCSQFPCENFRTGRYPFSQGFLEHAAATPEGKAAGVCTRRVPGQCVGGLLGTIAGQRYHRPLQFNAFYPEFVRPGAFSLSTGGCHGGH